MSIVVRYDADCEECWTLYANGYTSADKDALIRVMEKDDWLVIDDECWCPDCRHLVEGK